MSDDWRVEVELDDDEHGYTLSERLRSRELDDEARERLGPGAVVTRNGSRLFIYSDDESRVREAERVVRELLAEDDLTAELAVTRWHRIEEAWKDASIPLPRTEEERRAEYRRHEAAELRELQEEGEYDWEVRAELPGRRETVELGDRLRAEGLAVTRRWKYLLIGALTEERAVELARRVREEAPEGAVVLVEPKAAVPDPLFVFLGSR